MELTTTKAIIENILLVSDRPVTPDKIIETLEGAIDADTFKNIMDELMHEYKQRGIQIIEIAMGYQLATRPKYADWIGRFINIDRKTKLSKAALEVLSIIAYRQPITRIEIDTIRGVDSGGVVKSLIDKKLIRGMGRKKVIGKPMMFGTSRRFLEYFGLRNLADLPTIEEFREKEENINTSEENEGELRRKSGQLFAEQQQVEPDDEMEDEEELLTTEETTTEEDI
ncbi:MAG: SMC-Scp complex subunit ScpB [Nitrospinota bacterium]